MILRGNGSCQWGETARVQQRLFQKMGWKMNIVSATGLCAIKNYKLYLSARTENLKNWFLFRIDPEEKTNLLSSNDPEIKNEFEKLWKAVLTFPPKDNDPIYKPFQNNPGTKR